MSISAVLLFTNSCVRTGPVKRYEHLLTKRVEVRYRTDYLYHCATGTLATDNGRCLFIEDRFMQSGKQKMLRVEIPYECILSVVELPLETKPRP